jgi:hypothetical protein
MTFTNTVLQHKYSYPLLVVVCAAIIGGGVASIVLAHSKKWDDESRFTRPTAALTTLGVTMIVCGVVSFVMGRRALKGRGR